MSDDRQNTSSLLDLRHLSEQTFGSAELEAEVLRLFLKQSRECVDRLAATPDARHAHLLLGSARGIGATLVATAAAELEAVLLQGAEGRAELDRLTAAVGATGTFIEKRLGHGG